MWLSRPTHSTHTISVPSTVAAVWGWWRVLKAQCLVVQASSARACKLCLMRALDACTQGSKTRDRADIWSVFGPLGRYLSTFGCLWCDPQIGAFGALPWNALGPWSAPALLLWVGSLVADSPISSTHPWSCHRSLPPSFTLTLPHPARLVLDRQPPLFCLLTQAT